MIKEIVLASASPRRKEILERLGIGVTVRPANIKEEIAEISDPKELVATLAEQKANAVPRTEREVVLAADTIVTLDGIVLGKPQDRKDAEKTLRLLSGREHRVLTGFCILRGTHRITGTEETSVVFRKLTDCDIQEYLDTGEPFDKAGSYGIQGKGCLLVESISGDYNNVVGLPVSRMIAEIKGGGLDE